MKILLVILFFSFMGCAHYDTSIPVDRTNVVPGSQVKMKGETYKLYSVQSPLKVGDNLVEKAAKAGFELPFNNKVTLINVVPSVDTPVCEAQSHILGESKKIKKDIDLVSISRDLPMALNRFKKESKLTNIDYVSDYKKGSFGRGLGLMIQDIELLARGVIVLDSKGVIKHMQFIEEVSHLPNMDKAIQVANSLK